MTGIKAFSVIRGDERIHPRLREFDNELALDEHGKDFMMITCFFLKGTGQGCVANSKQNLCGDQRGASLCGRL